MSKLEYTQAIVYYHLSLYVRLWGSIDHLTEAQFIQDINYSHGSARNQVIHVASTDARWLRGLKGDPAARQFAYDPQAYPTRNSARAVWDATAKEFKDYLDSLDEAGLERQPPGMFGPVWQVIAHLVNHGTDHRAQILRALHDFGAPTFDQEMIFHFWRD